MPKGTTAAFNVERLRAQMLEGLDVPKDLLQKAIDTTHRHLTAKKVQFFSKDGLVTDQRIVEDNVTQLAAADKVFAMTGIYARERDQVVSQPTFAVEITPTGVIRIVVSEVTPPLASGEAVVGAAVLSDASKILEPPREEMSPPLARDKVTPLEAPEPTVVTVTPSNKKDVIKMLFEDE